MHSHYNASVINDFILSSYVQDVLPHHSLIFTSLFSHPAYSSITYTDSCFYDEPINLQGHLWSVKLHNSFSRTIFEQDYFYFGFIYPRHQVTYKFLFFLMLTSAMALPPIGVVLVIHPTLNQIHQSGPNLHVITFQSLLWFVFFCPSFIILYFWHNLHPSGFLSSFIVLFTYLIMRNVFLFFS